MQQEILVQRVANSFKPYFWSEYLLFLVPCLSFFNWFKDRHTSGQYFLFATEAVF